MFYKTSELAKLAGISSRTLRHYDNMGLLKPKRSQTSSYRLYDQQDVDKLQHILIYRAMGFRLDRIKHLVDNIDPEKRLALLNEQLKELHQQKRRIDRIIENISITIQSLKGNITMKDQDKFMGLKESAIKANDDLYKEEIIQNWGQDTYERSKKQFMNMSKEDYDQQEKLSKDIIDGLIRLSTDQQNEHLMHQVAKDHQTWITIMWGHTCEKEAHLNLVDMYLADKRFQAFYDKHKKGLTKLLRNAVYHFYQNT